MTVTTSHAIKVLYSYGGKILPRATDGELRYVGGYTRILTVDRSVSFSELMVKLGELCGSSMILRCQLPNGDLETLISIKNNDDLANIIEEYDHASSKLPHPLKIRAILSPPRSLKKVSPSTSSSSTSTAPSTSKSPHNSADSLPYVTAAYRTARYNRSPVVGYPIGISNVAAKASCYNGKFDRNPRFLYRGPYCNNYCH
ncbi:hypothetical protein TanjilG_27463 [Lupinus angustifolius]|uniref:PB1 domain-containing protein n=1 Tax=Lupinus angustifolius TaxID=3871 RepID=A0A394DLS5_LUPAN|nr:PREDICTED: uncharacterized protein LOC109339229 isoform X1 [Lupinus angustifolius]OIW21027.1 hypothetical protein TanjilG_27463 [Lupinus angustifolius]